MQHECDEHGRYSGQVRIEQHGEAAVTASGRTSSFFSSQQGERIVIAVLALVIWLAPLVALSHTTMRGPLPGSDICRTPSAKTPSEQPVAEADHRCHECCCSAVRLGGGLPATAGWFFLPASAPVLAGDATHAPRRLEWRDLAPPPRAPPAAAGIDATEPRIG